MTLIQYAVPGIKPIIIPSRTEEYHRTARVLSGYVSSLPLNYAQKQMLDDLIEEHTRAVENSGILDGGRLGILLALSDE